MQCAASPLPTGPDIPEPEDRPTAEIGEIKQVDRSELVGFDSLEDGTGVCASPLGLRSIGSDRANCWTDWIDSVAIDDVDGLRPGCIGDGADFTCELLQFFLSD